MAEHLKIMNKRMVLLNPVSAFLNFDLTPDPLFRNSCPNSRRKTP